jgi:hypothetical protein
LLTLELSQTRRQWDRGECRLLAVRPEGADHQWVKVPSG